MHDAAGGAETAIVVASKNLTGNGELEFTDLPYGGHNEYFLVRVKQEAGTSPADWAWAAPVWVSRED